MTGATPETERREVTGKRHILPALRWIALAVLVAAGIWYVTKHPDLLHALKGVSAPHLVIILVLAFATLLTQGLQLKLISSVFGLNLSFREWFGLTVCKSMYSSLMPGRPGVGAQAVYLKKRHGFALTDYGTLFAASSLVDAVSAATLGLAACLAGGLLGGTVPSSLVPVLLVLLGISLAGCLVAVAFGGAVRFIPFAVLRRPAARVSEGFRLLAKRPGMLLWILLTGALRLAAACLVFYVAGLALDMSMSLPQAATIGSLSSFGVFLPLTPGSIGICEGIIAASGRVFGLSPESAMLAALILRAAFAVLAFGLGFIFNHLLLSTLVDGRHSDAANPAA